MIIHYCRSWSLTKTNRVKLREKQTKETNYETKNNTEET